MRYGSPSLSQCVPVCLCVCVCVTTTRYLVHELLIVTLTLQGLLPPGLVTVTHTRVCECVREAYLKGPFQKKTEEPIIVVVVVVVVVVEEW